MAEPVQVRFTRHLRAQRKYVNARWMGSLRGFLRGIEWIVFHGHLDYFQKPPLGGRPNTKPGDHGTPNAHNRWFILFYHVWGPAWIEIHWNSIWLRAWSHMTSHYTWGSVTTLHDFGGVSGRPLDTFFWALTISWSRLLARGWSGPMCIMRIAGTFKSQGTLGGMMYFESHGCQTTLNIVFIVIWCFFKSMWWLSNDTSH